jgi:hypothetical protein
VLSWVQLRMMPRRKRIFVCVVVREDMNWRLFFFQFVALLFGVGVDHNSM